MRTQASLLALTLVTVAACSGGDERRTALAPDLQADLSLATTTVALPAPQANQEFALETAPTSAPAPATTLRRSPSGRRAVRSDVRTVAATPEDTPAPTEELVTEVAQTPAAAEAPADAAPASEGVALPRPSAIPIVLPSAGSGHEPEVIDQGSGRRGGGIFGPIGVVIRGGGVDGDNCELHDRRRGRRPVYTPNPGGIAGGRRPGGWGGGQIATRMPRY